MVDILHRVGVKSPTPDKVYEALTTVEGLAGWWADDTKGVGDVGGFDMEVLELDPAGTVRWRVTDGPDEWIGTEVAFALDQRDEYTIVLFQHEGWAERNEFMHHCSTKWATFLMSLKQLVETGSGQPAPHDVQVSNWH